MWGIELTVMMVMIAFNAVFAAYELALASVDAARLDRLAREEHHGSAAALYMKWNMEGSLATVQLGITLVGAVAAATGGSGAQAHIQPQMIQWGIPAAWAQVLSIAVVVVPLTVVMIVVGELVPKVFALKNKEWVCLRLSPAMRWFSLCVRPAVWLLEGMTSLITRWGERRWKPTSEDRRIHEESALQELHAVAGLARTFRLIGVRQEDIIVNAARLSSTPLRTVMLPAEHISMLNADDSLSECLIAAHHDMHTRFPVTERRGDPQAIVGYVNFKDIVACMRLSPQEPSIRGILRPLPNFRDDISAAVCLEKLTHERNHIALVRDDEEHVVGMVTLEDILEELVGEIHDEYDRVPSYVTRSGNAWIVGGYAKLSHLREVTGIELRLSKRAAIPPAAATVSDWVIDRLGKPVTGGEIITADGVRAIVRKVRRQQVLEAQIAQEATVGAEARSAAEAET